MFGWLFRRKRPYDRDELMNKSLSLAMAWGKNWLKPIQERLRRSYPDLTQDELNEFNDLAQSTMKFGHDLVYSSVEKNGVAIDKALFENAIKAKYPWVTRRNVNYLYSQGRYYAWKDFG